MGFIDYGKDYWEKHPEFREMSDEEFEKNFDTDEFVKSLNADELKLFAIDCGVGSIDQSIDEFIDKTLDDYNDGIIDLAKMNDELSFLSDEDE